MGEGTNSLNMWIAANHCGGETGAPGMDLFPQRLTKILGDGDGGAIFTWSVSDHGIKNAHLKNTIIAPVFEAGDALCFDHFLLHRTQHDNDFIRPRYAMETWVFGKKPSPKIRCP